MKMIKLTLSYRVINYLIAHYNRLNHYSKKDVYKVYECGNETF